MTRYEACSLPERIRRRDQTALDELIGELSGPVLHLVGTIVGTAGSAEDYEELAADVFAAVWHRVGEFDPARGSFRSWVFMVAKYMALDCRRRLSRQAAVPGGGARVVPLHQHQPAAPDTPEQALLAEERRRRLQWAIQQLPEADRELIIRRYFLEEPISELARAAGVSHGAVYNRLWRARQALKSILSDDQSAVQGVSRGGAIS